jgi:hypothetical protein
MVRAVRQSDGTKLAGMNSGALHTDVVRTCRHELLAAKNTAMDWLSLHISWLTSKRAAKRMQR